MIQHNIWCNSLGAFFLIQRLLSASLGENRCHYHGSIQDNRDKRKRREYTEVKKYLKCRKGNAMNKKGFMKKRTDVQKRVGEASGKVKFRCEVSVR